MHKHELSFIRLIIIYLLSQGLFKQIPKLLFKTLSSGSYYKFTNRMIIIYSQGYKAYHVDIVVEICCNVQVEISGEGFCGYRVLISEGDRNGCRLPAHPN